MSSSLWNPPVKVIADSDSEVETSTGTQKLGVALDSRVIYVDTLADLQALPTGRLVNGQEIHISTTGREGPVIWSSSDMSSEVADDEVTPGAGDGGKYIAPASDKTGASGAFVRPEGPIRFRHYGAVSGAGVDNTGPWQAAARFVNRESGHIVIDKSDAAYEISQGAAFYSGVIEHENNALIRNVADDDANFWNNTCAFFGSYFGYDSAEGVTGEASYSINPVTGGDRSFSLSTPSEDANFSVGDVVFIHDANKYSGTDFYVASHVTEVTGVSSGTISVRDPFVMDITADGATAPVVYVATGTISTTATGQPDKAKLARGLEVINGQYESINISFNQVVHVSSFDCQFDFNYIKGRSCLGINPCAHTKINCKEILYYARALELAYFHQNVVSNYVFARRAGLPEPDTLLSIPFSVSEYGNITDWGIVDIQDESWANDNNTSAIQFSTPHNTCGILRVNGSQLNGITFVSGRGEDTTVDVAHIVHAENTGVDISANNVIINKLIVDNLPDNSGNRAALVSSGVTGAKIIAARLGNGGASGRQYSIEDENGAGTKNQYGSITGHYSQETVNDGQFTSKAGTGLEVTDQTYSIPAGTSTKHSGWRVRVKGNITGTSTNGSKSIKIDFNGSAVELSVGSPDVGFFDIDAIVRKANSNTQQEITGTSAMMGVEEQRTITARSDNMLTTSFDISLKYNLVAGDDFNLREWSVEPFNDNFEI